MARAHQDPPPVPTCARRAAGSGPFVVGPCTRKRGPVALVCHARDMPGVIVDRPTRPGRGCCEPCGTDTLVLMAAPPGSRGRAGVFQVLRQRATVLLPAPVGPRTSAYTRLAVMQNCVGQVAVAVLSAPPGPCGRAGVPQLLWGQWCCCQHRPGREAAPGCCTHYGKGQWCRGQRRPGREAGPGYVYYGQRGNATAE